MCSLSDGHGVVGSTFPLEIHLPRLPLNGNAAVPLYPSRVRAVYGRRLTSIGDWQKKTAEECRIVQEIAGSSNARNPENAGKYGIS